ncbi:MAG TPA: thioredoxin domain-containing protein [Micromonosporaceae bacterium]
MTTPLQVTTKRLRIEVTEDEHIRGAIDAPVTLVQYADFQCRHCREAYPSLLEVLDQRREIVRLVFRHFPLANVHPYAELVAETAEAAGDHGCFWELHDWIFEHQDQLDPVHLALGAEQVGLPVDQVVEEVNAHTRLDRIHHDFVNAIYSGVDATPTIFVNGVRHDGGCTVAELLKAIDQVAP